MGSSLGWAGALLTLALAGLWLGHVGAVCSIECALSRAAEAACREAIAPRATLASAERAARRTLGEHSTLGRRARLTAEARRATASDEELDLHSGDAVTIRLVARAEELLPKWLAAWWAPREGRLLVGSATRRQP
jgi:hypothetical protein